MKRHLDRSLRLSDAPAVVVFAVIDDSLSATSPLDDAVDTFVRREEAERYTEEVRGDNPALRQHLRIEERELEAGALN